MMVRSLRISTSLQLEVLMLISMRCLCWGENTATSLTKFRLIAFTSKWNRQYVQGPGGSIWVLIKPSPVYYLGQCKRADPAGQKAGKTFSDSLPQGSSCPHQISSATVFSSLGLCQDWAKCYLLHANAPTVRCFTYLSIPSNFQSILPLSLRYNTDFNSLCSSSRHDKNCHHRPSFPLFPFPTAPLFSEIKPDDFPVKAKRGKKKKKSAEAPERKKPKLDELKVLRFYFLPLGRVAYSQPFKFHETIAQVLCK